MEVSSLAATPLDVRVVQPIRPNFGPFSGPAPRWNCITLRSATTYRLETLRQAATVAADLRHGMIRPSYIPPRAIRYLHDFTGRRKQLVRSGPWAPDLAGVGWGPVFVFERNDKVAEARPSLSAAREAVSTQR
jgi:hypothetical protein